MLCTLITRAEFGQHLAGGPKQRQPAHGVPGDESRLHAPPRPQEQQLLQALEAGLPRCCGISYGMRLSGSGALPKGATEIPSESRAVAYTVGREQRCQAVCGAIGQQGGLHKEAPERSLRHQSQCLPAAACDGPTPCAAARMCVRIVVRLPRLWCSWCLYGDSSACW